MSTRGGTHYTDPPWPEDVDRLHPNQPTAKPSQPEASEDRIRPPKPLEPKPHATPPDLQDILQEPPRPRQTSDEDGITQRNKPVYTPPPSKPPLPYPQRQIKAKLDKQFSKFLEMLKQLHVTMSFPEAIASVFCNVWSMVQVTSRSADGSIKYCRIHDLLRDLALQKAKEDNFLIVYSHLDDQHNLCMARRVAVHNSDCDELMMSKNLRTMLCFRTNCMPNCSKQRMLKVVSIETLLGATIEINLEMFEGLTQLRYLDLGGIMASRENRSLGETIGNMKFLQTVSARVWANHQLRLSGHKALRHATGFEVELHSSAKLPNLQTLDGVNWDESWETPYVPNLRTFDLMHFSSSWEAPDAFLSTLKNLISLRLETCLSFNGKLDMRDFPFYQNLQSLILYSGSTELIDMPIDMPPHLSALTLSNLKFRQDIMPAPEKLQYLKELYLRELDTNEKMCCSAKGFSQLERLSIHEILSKGLGDREGGYAHS